MAGTLTLTGEFFGAARGNGTVDFSGIPGVVSSWSDTQIELTVPDLLPGPVTIRVTNDAGSFGEAPFTVVLPPVVYLNLESKPNQVAALSFDPATGALTELPGSPYAAGGRSCRYGGDASTVWVNEATIDTDTSGLAATF